MHVSHNSTERWKHQGEWQNQVTKYILLRKQTGVRDAPQNIRGGIRATFL